jgi:hypothetical protein
VASIIGLKNARRLSASGHNKVRGRFVADELIRSPHSIGHGAPLLNKITRSRITGTNRGSRTNRRRSMLLSVGLFGDLRLLSTLS